MGGKIGVLLEVNCQTDFVARTDDFKNFCKDIAMHIAGRDPFPQFVSDEEIPAALIERERNFQAEKAKESGKGKPDNIIAKIIDGAVVQVEEGHLLARPRVRQGPEQGHPHPTAGADGEDGREDHHPPLHPLRARRWLQKKEQDFAQEVAAQVAATRRPKGTP
jgi:elongation factor Ts